MSERCVHSFHETGRCPRCNGESNQVIQLREALTLAHHTERGLRAEIDGHVRDKEVWRQSADQLREALRKRNEGLQKIANMTHPDTQSAGTYAVQIAREALEDALNG